MIRSRGAGGQVSCKCLQLPEGRWRTEEKGKSLPVGVKGTEVSRTQTSNLVSGRGASYCCDETLTKGKVGKELRVYFILQLSAHQGESG